MKTLLAMLLLSSAAFAQTAAERFDALPEAKKAELRTKLERFKALPPETQQRLKDNLARFKAMTPGGDNTDPTSNTLVGEDSTTGPGGACGRSLPLFIAMPFKLVKVG